MWSMVPSAEDPGVGEHAETVEEVRALAHHAAKEAERNLRAAQNPPAQAVESRARQLAKGETVYGAVDLARASLRR